MFANINNEIYQEKKEANCVKKDVFQIKCKNVCNKKKTFD